MMDINESLTTFTDTSSSAQDNCSNSIQASNIVAEELDDMDLLVYSDSDDDMRTPKLSIGHLSKPMERINEGTTYFCIMNHTNKIFTDFNQSLNCFRPRDN